MLKLINSEGNEALINDCDLEEWIERGYEITDDSNKDESSEDSSEDESSEDSNNELAINDFVDDRSLEALEAMGVITVQDFIDADQMIVIDKVPFITAKAYDQIRLKIINAVGNE